MKDKVLSMLGLAKRAGSVTVGEKFVLAELKKVKNPVLFLASDAGDNIVEKIKKKELTIPMVVCRKYTITELSQAIGTKNNPLVLVTKEGFNEQLRNRLKS